MQTILLRNLVVVIFFMLTDLIFVVNEYRFVESTAELICMGLFLLLLITLYLVNLRNHAGIGNRRKRVAYRLLTVSISFTFCWALSWIISRV